MAKLRYYQGGWEFFGYYVCYDLDGMPAAYAIVFRKHNSQITTHEKLDSALLRMIEEKNRALNQMSQLEESHNASRARINKLRKIADSKKRSLYMQNQFATVITGPTTIAPLHINHYRGLPTFFIKKKDVQTKLNIQFPDKTFQLGNFLYLNQLDIRYEIQEAVGEPLQRQVKRVDSDIKKQKIPDKVYVSRKGGDVEKISTLREKMKEKSLKKARTLEKMSIKERKLMEEGEKNRKIHYVKRWEQYRNKHQEMSE